MKATDALKMVTVRPSAFEKAEDTGAGADADADADPDGRTVRPAMPPYPAQSVFVFRFRVRRPPSGYALRLTIFDTNTFSNYTAIVPKPSF